MTNSAAGACRQMGAMSGGLRDVEHGVEHSAEHHARSAFPARGSRVHASLYEDDEGDEVGREGVQLLDEVSDSRRLETERLATHPHPVVRFEAALILAAWGHDAGMSALEALIERGPDGAVPLSPHRLTGEDNFLDEIAHAMHLFAQFGGDERRALEGFHQLLRRYPDHFFESRLKWALSQYDLREFEGGVRAAMLGCLATGRPYQGSQLLPVYARLNPAAAAELVPVFCDLPDQTPNPKAIVAEALGHLQGTPHAAQFADVLMRLAESPAPGVADAAREALARARQA